MLNQLPSRVLTAPSDALYGATACRVVNQQFQTLMEDQQSHSRRKVLAGLVMTTGPQMSEVKVISVTTGTKCINGEHMSVEGNSLNDCHAEVISRRCLMDFLYSQLEMLLQPGESPPGPYLLVVPGPDLLVVP